ncbi:hypothetical protein GCM10022225_85080 [Plantactinospora mayteni]
MRLRYNYRLYPDAAQREALARSFGCARVVFNDGLRQRQRARRQGEKYLSDGELSKLVITQAKDTPERAWLSEVSSVVLQQALADLNAAYRNFYASISGKRKGRKVAPPRFRSRKENRQAVRFTKNSRFKVLDNGRLRLPKIGDVEVRWSQGACLRPVLRDGDQGFGRAVLRVVRRHDRAGRDTAASGLRDRNRPRADPLRGALRRHEGCRAEVPAPRRAQTQAAATSPLA